MRKAGVVQGVVLCKELLCFGEVSATEDLIEPSADEGFVLFRRRERPFLDLLGSCSLLNLYPQGNTAKGRAWAERMHRPVAVFASGPGLLRRSAGKRVEEATRVSGEKELWLVC